jgi:hypothetical protein
VKISGTAHTKCNAVTSGLAYSRVSEAAGLKSYRGRIACVQSQASEHKSSWLESQRQESS